MLSVLKVLGLIEPQESTHSHTLRNDLIADILSIVLSSSNGELNTILSIDLCKITFFANVLLYSNYNLILVFTCFTYFVKGESLNIPSL